MDMQSECALCSRCGLPKYICVCDEIKKQAKKKPQKEPREKPKDDFKYCYDCGVRHYPGCHIKKGEENDKNP